MKKTSFNLSKKCVLLIMDGLGKNPKDLKNAVIHAKTPNLDRYFSQFPYIEIEASGEPVGLPKGLMGNSEVGHLNLGAGRPVRQDLVRINECIDNDRIEENEVYRELLQQIKKKKKIHLLGLLSDGGVHSHIEHIKYFIKKFSNTGVEVYFHAFMDGRDTLKTNGLKYIQDLSSSNFKFASLQGRSIGMDRDRRWEKIEKSYKTLIGNAHFTELSPSEYIQSQYDQNIFDEFIEPIMFDKESSIEDKDIIFFLNFRPDRARQITQAFNLKDFTPFDRPILPSQFICMTPYCPEELPELPIMFDKEPLSNGLSEFLSNQKVNQYKSAETEKFAHVTYFFNGGKRDPFPGETWKLVESPKDVATYDLKPEMSAHPLTKSFLEALDHDYQFYLLNFANPDMVGHTGNFEAAVKAVETVDKCVGEIVAKCLKENISVLLTADHGNCDQMIHEDGSSHTAHTNVPVPFCLVHPQLENSNLARNSSQLALKDIAPTVLHILGYNKPKNFQGIHIFE